MTKKQAKELTIEVWDYLAKHGVEYKEYLPSDLWNKIKTMREECPLCELYNNNDVCDAKCPLKTEKGVTCFDKDSYFARWYVAVTSKTRAKYAAKIRDAVKAWEV